MTVSAVPGPRLASSRSWSAAEAAGKGLFVLAATSNPEAAAIQRAVLQQSSRAGYTVAQAITQGVIGWNQGRADAATRALGSIGVVFGATIDLRLAGIDTDAEPPRPGLPVLAPGFGHQGAEPGDLRARFGGFAAGVIASESRSCWRPVPMASPTPSRAAPTSTEQRLPETTDPATAPSPPEVDRVAASRAAVAARRARAAVKADVASGARSPLDVLREAFADRPRASRGACGCPSSSRRSPRSARRKSARIMEELEIAHVQAARRPRAPAAQAPARVRRRLGRRPRRHAETASSCSRGRPPSARAPSRRTSGGTTPRSACRSRRRRAPPRPGEVDGEHYFFVDDAEFDRMVAAGELLEWATVHNASRYGTPRRPVEEAIAAGSSVLLEIDIQGARPVRRAMPEATLVFLLPPSWDELVRRLVGRGTESPAEQQRRLETAKVELAAVERVRPPGREPRRRRGRARGRRLDEAPQGSALSCPGRKFPRTEVRTFRSKESVHG